MKISLKTMVFSLCFAISPLVHAVEYGDILGDFNGVVIRSNIGREENGTWQCVEFVKRYYFEFFKVTLPAVGNANQYFGSAAQLGLARHANNSSLVRPRVGDVLVSNGSSNNVGHVAIVRSTSDTQVCVVGQNFNQDTRDADGTHCMTMTGDSSSGYSIAPFGTNYPVTGWLRPTCETALEKPCKIKSPKSAYMGWYPRTNLCQDATQWFILGSEDGKKVYSGITDVSSCPQVCFAN